MPPGNRSDQAAGGRRPRRGRDLGRACSAIPSGSSSRIMTSLMTGHTPTRAGFHDSRPGAPAAFAETRCDILVSWYDTRSKEEPAMGMRDLFFVGVVLGGTATLGAGLSGRRARPGSARREAGPRPATRSAADRRRGRRRDPPGMGREKAYARPAAPELAVMRRLSLALTGTVPSLEEIRRFEKRPAGTRSTPGSTTSCAIAAPPTTWPSGWPGPSSAPRMARSWSSAAAGSPRGSATRSWPIGRMTRSSAT